LAKGYGIKLRRFWGKKLRLILFGIIFVAYSSYAQLNLSKSSIHPIWSDLTPFEIKTLNGIPAAKRGSDEALLRLFVFGSGNVRQTVDFKKIKSRINQFYEIYSDEINNEQKIWQKGYLLNRAMHQYFFSKGREQSEDSYEADQSQLSGIFVNGQYNCVSSTILYIYLAKRFDLDVEAVILPTHTFVELDLHNGSRVDVETTSSTGFDWAHDRRFYKDVAKNWFSDRGLSPSTYEDYQNREIVPAWKLAALNMRNQHINPDRMSLLDRTRLLETSLFLDDTDEKVWLSNLFIFNELFILYNNQNNLKLIKDIYTIHYEKFVNYFHENVETNNELFEPAQWYFSQAAYTYIKHGDLIKARKILLEHYFDAYQLKSTKPKLLSNNQVVFQELLNAYFKNKQYALAETLIVTTHDIASLQTDWQNSVAWYYSERITPMWNKQDWTGIINYWKQVKSRRIPTEEMKLFIKNTSAAYQNKSLDYERKGNWRAAAEVLLQCTENIPLALDCSKKLEKLKSQHKIF